MNSRELLDDILPEHNEKHGCTFELHGVCAYPKESSLHCVCVKDIHCKICESKGYCVKCVSEGGHQKQRIVEYLEKKSTTLPVAKRIGEDEMKVIRYECPFCNYGYVLQGDKFCRNCGKGVITFEVD